MAAATEIVGLRAFRKELKTLEDPRKWTKALGQLNRDIGKEAADDSRREATGMGHEQGHFADAIRGYGSAASARIAIARAAKGQPLYGANGAFFGSKQFAQFNDWVGVGWDVAVRGQGPIAINDAIADNADKYAAKYGDGFMELAAGAFPART